jgi:hypothetical protein
MDELFRASSVLTGPEFNSPYSSMLAITFTATPQAGQVSMSMPKTRFRRCTQVMHARRSAGVGGSFVPQALLRCPVWPASPTPCACYWVQTPREDATGLKVSIAGLPDPFRALFTTAIKAPNSAICRTPANTPDPISDCWTRNAGEPLRIGPLRSGSTLPGCRGASPDGWSYA